MAKFNKDTWIGDTGATSHMIHNDEGLLNVTLINEKVKIGNGKEMRATKRGTLPCTIVQTDGTKTNCSIEVKVLPDLWCNLFSITGAIKKGFQISNKGMMLQLSKGSTTIKFDRIGETTHGGFLVGVEIARQTSNTNLAMMDKHQRIDVNELHKSLSHASEVAIRNTATMFGWILKNTFKPCEDCAIAKAKQKNIKGNVTKGSTIKGE